MSQVFVSVLRHTESMGELEASRDLVAKEVTRLRWSTSYWWLWRWIKYWWLLMWIHIDVWLWIIWGLKLACDYIDERVDLLLSAKVGLFFIIWNPTQSRSRDSKAEDSEGCRLQLNSLLYLRFGQKQVTWVEQPTNICAKTMNWK